VKKIKFEDFLLPHEHKDGKKLDEPEELDVEKLRKYVYSVLTDKEEAQEARDAALADKDTAEAELRELQKKNETDEERRAREQAERDKEIADLKKRDQERAKIEALSDHFKDQGITLERARRLAKRVDGEDEKAWLASADELVEDGFRISDRAETKAKEDEDVDDEDDEPLVPVVKATRNGRQIAPATKGRPKSVSDELDAAGIGPSGW